MLAFWIEIYIEFKITGFQFQRLGSQRYCYLLCGRGWMICYKLNVNHVIPVFIGIWNCIYRVDEGMSFSRAHKSRIFLPNNNERGKSGSYFFFVVWVPFCMLIERGTGAGMFLFHRVILCHAIHYKMIFLSLPPFPIPVLA